VFLARKQKPQKGNVDKIIAYFFSDKIREDKYARLYR